MAPATQLTIQEEEGDKYGEDVSLKRRVSCARDDIKPLLLVAHIPSHDNADSMFEIAFLRWTEKLAQLRACTAECVNEILSLPVVVKMLSLQLCSTSLLIRKKLLVLWCSTKQSVRKLGSVVMPLCRTSPNPQTITSSMTPTYPFDVSKYTELEGRKQVAIFQAVFENALKERGFGKRRQRLF